MLDPRSRLPSFTTCAAKSMLKAPLQSTLNNDGFSHRKNSVLRFYPNESL